MVNNKVFDTDVLFYCNDFFFLYKYIEQITAYIEKMNIKESAFRVLEQEFRSAQKYIDKLNQDIITMKNNKEK